ncbi:bifunctional 2-C-methyl-D-erythritol 4-phosphate cytidylyltransferase/2-C-methyl-D-erythritol 2,4-cyclodiphosphate synthase [Tropicimonas sp. S265A]|uniref:bifunctional 2-C-methyl-D-erythritol 4-phosphate cytidylyltransferase/2-C-methyl-D-erythritol 2,4-cyclodiphosphate synthase n=1 Tax=Tropicimonas sp. S265A TaxID=3415134 RepID=UPI003C7E076B
MTVPTAPCVAAIVVAAGRGLRAGGEMPKQWSPLAGRRVLDWTIAAFDRQPEVAEIIVVLHPDDMALAETLSSTTPLRHVAGGATRDASVRSALKALSPSAVAVLIHDAARPCVSADLIAAVIRATIETGAAAPALPVTDALWTGADGRVTGTRERAGLYRAQTPQGFRPDLIVAAHAAHPGGAADDVEVARAAGHAVTIVPGEARNLKITYPDDFARAETLIKDVFMDIRTGNGYDVHRFGPGEAVILCGVEIPHDRTLQGHSDADVGMHAVTDAIYGALGDGDIGQHFPPSDPQWKGAASEIFLRHAVELATGRGYTITHMDCTLVCERPKIGPHHAAMKGKMADLMGLKEDQVSVKATTSERLGFTGREEGIAALATVTLVRA